MATATPAITEFRVVGMTCQNCVRHVTEAIQSVASVTSASVELEASKATVRWKPDAAPSPDAVVSAGKGAGYSASVLTAGGSHGAHVHSKWSPLAGWRFNAFFGGVVTLILMFCEWILNAGTAPWCHWLGFALAAPVQVLCGAHFYRGAWGQLKAGSSNMDTLVALGSTTAFAFSVWGLFAGWHGHLYFMEAASIITLISIGHWMESVASTRAASSLRGLMNLAPAKARKLAQLAGQPASFSAGTLLGGPVFSRTAPVETEVEVSVAELQAGDRVVLRPGDHVPVDGVVLEGESAVDEAMLTGESLPVEKTSGAQLFAGTANQNGRLIMRVTATGEDTALANIIAVVQRAQSSRANIQRLGDRVSSFFVPVVVLLAIATALWWGLNYDGARARTESLMGLLWTMHVPETALAAAFIQAAAVLIVACPCAMGLATPAAIMAGTNAAARRGILIRDGEALEKSGTITAVIFDKTGTITEGSIRVSGVLDLRAEKNRAVPLEQIAAALARPSNHPLSRAVAKLADRTGTTASSVTSIAGWQELRGNGVRGRLLGAAADLEVQMGSFPWLRSLQVSLAAADKFVDEHSASGATLLGLAADGQLLGVIALRDTLDAKAAEVLTQLARKGQKVFLLTGDHRRSAEAIARQAGIAPDNVFAEVRPEQKADVVRQLQQRGERVAFVGDGINDAPALEQADLGIAVARASDVAREAADIILLKSDLAGIPEALGLAQATLRTIKQNLFWAFFYNAASIPLAMMGFLNPVLCAAAMGLSDLLVIGNALRLFRWKA